MRSFPSSSTLPAVSTPRKSSSTAPEPGTVSGPEYSEKAAPSSEYSIRATREPESAEARVTVRPSRSARETGDVESTRKVWLHSSETLSEASTARRVTVETPSPTTIGSVTGTHSEPSRRSTTGDSSSSSEAAAVTVTSLVYQPSSPFGAAGSTVTSSSGAWVSPMSGPAPSVKTSSSVPPTPAYSPGASFSPVSQPTSALSVTRTRVVSTTSKPIETYSVPETG